MSAIPHRFFEKKSDCLWPTFRQQYADLALVDLSLSAAQRVLSLFDLLEQIARPRKLTDIDGPTISKLVKALRQRGNADTTIRTQLAHLRGALHWAARQGLLAAVPKFDVPRRGKRQKLMKGRPLTDVEFQSMLSAVPNVVPDDQVECWSLLLKSLWWGGLRLSEALELSWEPSAAISLDPGRRLLLRIRAGAEKGGQDRLLPLAPQFAELLLSLPREGRVHRLPARGKESVSRIISRIGRQAGIVVNHLPVKYASAHDLRRSFGERWARLVMPPILMQLMRHESIETTMRYYVGREAETTVDLLYAALGR